MCVGAIWCNSSFQNSENSQIISFTFKSFVRSQMKERSYAVFALMMDLESFSETHPIKRNSRATAKKGIHFPFAICSFLLAESKITQISIMYLLLRTEVTFYFFFISHVYWCATRKLFCLQSFSIVYFGQSINQSCCTVCGVGYVKWTLLKKKLLMCFKTHIYLYIVSACHFQHHLKWFEMSKIGCISNWLLKSNKWA